MPQISWTEFDGQSSQPHEFSPSISEMAHFKAFTAREIWSDVVCLPKLSRRAHLASSVEYPQARSTEDPRSPDSLEWHAAPRLASNWGQRSNIVLPEKCFQIRRRFSLQERSDRGKTREHLAYSKQLEDCVYQKASQATWATKLTQQCMFRKNGVSMEETSYTTIASNLFLLSIEKTLRSIFLATLTWDA